MNTIRRLIFCLLAGTVTLLTLGCSGNGSQTVLPPQPVGVQYTQVSANAIDIGQSDLLTATVYHDPTGKGVNWAVICPSGVIACGSMAQVSTASGTANTYNAPHSVNSAESVTIKATAISDATEYATAQVTVNPPPALNNPPAGAIAVGRSPFVLDLNQYIRGGTPPLTWSLKSGTIPLGLGLDTGRGMITGSPIGAAVIVALVFTATDSGTPAVSVDLPISFSIASAPALQITGPAILPNGTVGVVYGSRLNVCFFGRCPPPIYGVLVNAANGAQPYSWSWAAAAGSSLPPGLGVAQWSNLAARIFGMPTTAGTYNVIVTVTDSDLPPKQASVNYTITIH